MLKGYRLKHLFLKMGYKKLEETCLREGWKIPMTTELQHYDIKHDSIWTASTVLGTQYKPTEDDIKHGVKVGICYSHKDNREHVVNKNFQMNCVVLVKDEAKDEGERDDGYEQLIDGEPITMLSNETFKFKCCDCGLVHNMVVATEKKQEIGFVVERVDE